VPKRPTDLEFFLLPEVDIYRFDKAGLADHPWP